MPLHQNENGRWFFPEVEGAVLLNKDRIQDLRQQGQEAAEITWREIQEHGWPSLAG